MRPKGKEEEDSWIKAFGRGEEKALAYFFEVHYKSLGYFANRLVQDSFQAEDIVAECFVKLWKGDRAVKDADSIKAFLYISCRNACLDYLRHLKVKTQVQQIYFNELEKSEETILANIVESEVMDMLAGEIELLPEKCREVFKLIYFDHKKTDEIAEELGISPKTVRNHKAKAIELLKVAVLKKGLSGTLYLAFQLFLNLR